MLLKKVKSCVFQECWHQLKYVEESWSYHYDELILIPRVWYIRLLQVISASNAGAEVVKVALPFFL